MIHPPIVSPDEWRAARVTLLEQEKELTRARDALNVARRALPMTRVEKPYLFGTPDGPATLAELFAGRRQLIVYHFMFHRDRGEGCPGCSHLTDGLPHLAHLQARDTAFTLVSRAPLAELELFRARMGWSVPWVSSFGSEFNHDYHVTLDESVAPIEYNYMNRAALAAAGFPALGEPAELPGISVFLRDGEAVYHTYSSYARGHDLLVATYNWLDLTPFGRGEGWDGMPDLDGKGLGWLRHHDRYES